MKRFFVLILSALSVLAAVAAEYRPLVEEGKTWWYTQHANDVNDYEYGIRIDKEVMINDTLWHPCRLIVSDKYQNDTVKCHSAWRSDTLIYVREEGHKVYARPHAMDLANSPEVFYYFLYMMDSSCMIYDFTVEPGVEYSLEGNSYTDPLPEIASKYSIENSGLEYNVYAFKDDKMTLMIEGIGNVELPPVVRPHFNTAGLFFNPFYPKCPCFTYYLGPVLRWVTDKDDNVLFEAEGGLKLWEYTGEETAAEYRPLVEEGKTWWYTHLIHTLNRFEYGITIGGDTIVNDTAWHVCQVVLNDHYHNANLEPQYEWRRDTIALIREQDKKVYYKHLPGIEVNEAIQSGFYGSEGFITGASIMIYDFSAKPGEEYILEGNHSDVSSWLIERYELIDRLYVASVDTLTNSGYDYPVHTLISHTPYLDEDQYGFPFVEGIGAANIPSADIGRDYMEYYYGLFFNPYDGYDVIPCACISPFVHTRPKLRWVTDKDDNVLFEAEGGLKLWEYTGGLGVTSIGADEAAPAEYFNLQGVRVDCPTQTGVYIRCQGSKATKVVIR